ncbi:helix-turn-helix domain-containing protein [Bacillus sp. 165]|uniref:PucR family transcriptional regulator n=1 Tax=Bacillus sp. 165 TaxID=1529117 RepID=UPI001ADAB4C2|nr:helix-turn-helix domain-containing protein [Bacillus sp. 165]MBO9128753.1 helix-turn-helix domain-containing protein [Bacillus sp. 165]
MLERLKDYYKGAIIINTLPDNQEDYQWFADETNSIIGIEKQTISEKDFAIISLFLTPITNETLHFSSEQRLWQKLLFQKNAEEQVHALLEQINKANTFIRFIQFHIREPFFEKLAFEEALYGLLSSQFIIVWKDNQYGTIIEIYEEQNPEQLLNNHIFDTLISDFYVSITAFAGRLYPLDSTLISSFHWENQIFQTVRQYNKNKSLLQMEDILPRFLLNEIKQETHQQFSQQILQDVSEDKELLTTIRAFLEYNMNVSLAAKKLYMHRNSVQYRVDKFIEKTGIDIKSFKGAVSIYLALLAYEQASI